MPIAQLWLYLEKYCTPGLALVYSTYFSLIGGPLGSRQTIEFNYKLPVLVFTSSLLKNYNFNSPSVPFRKLNINDYTLTGGWQDKGVLETNKINFRFEPKQTETQPVSVVFLFVSRNQ
jgi:hypothetical protein